MQKRFGPSYPLEMKMMTTEFEKVRDPLDDQQEIYPKKVCLASGDKVLDFELRVVYSFATLRKFIVEAW